MQTISNATSRNEHANKRQRLNCSKLLDWGQVNFFAAILLDPLLCRPNALKSALVLGARQQILALSATQQQQVRCKKVSEWFAQSEVRVERRHAARHWTGEVRLQIS